MGADIRIAIRRGIIRIERREARISAIIRIAARASDTPAGVSESLKKKSPRFARMRGAFPFCMVSY